MRILLAILLLGSLWLSGIPNAQAEIAQTALSRQSFLDGRVSLLVPRSFRRLSAADIRRKYPGRNRPPVVLADRSTQVNIAVNYSPFRMKAADLPRYVQQLRAAVRRRSKDAKVLVADTIRISGREFMRFHLETQSSGTRIDNYIVATVLAGRLLLVTFNSTIAKRAIWSAQRERIIRSIRVPG